MQKRILLYVDTFVTQYNFYELCYRLLGSTIYATIYYVAHLLATIAHIKKMNTC